MSRPRRENYSRKSYDPRRAFGSANYLNTVTGGGLTLPRTGLIFYAKAPGMVDTIGLSIVSGAWPNCIVQAIPGGPLESWGPFTGEAQINFALLPEDIGHKFFWGARGYAFYSAEQSIANVKRILNYLSSDSYVDYIYINGEPLTINGEQVAAVIGA